MLSKKQKIDLKLANLLRILWGQKGVRLAQTLKKGLTRLPLLVPIFQNSSRGKSHRAGPEVGSRPARLSLGAALGPGPQIGRIFLASTPLASHPICVDLFFAFLRESQRVNFGESFKRIICKVEKEA